MLKPRIMVCVDGSALAHTALAHGVRLAGPDDELVLVRVVELGLDLRDSSPIMECTEEEALVALHSLGRTAGRDVSYRVSVGNPAQEILQLASAENVRLLVLASHGRTGLFRWTEGSVARHVARKAPCPVWLVLPNHPAEPVHKALVPLDLSQEAEEALSHVRDFLPAGGELVLVTALHMLPDPVSGEPLERHVQRYLGELVDRFRQVGVRAESIVVEGSVAEGILRTALEERADMIVMASHGRRGPSRWLLGSVAEDVVRASPCPVLLLGPRCRRPLGVIPADCADGRRE